LSEIDAKPDAIADFRDSLAECLAHVKGARDRLDGLPPSTWCDDTVVAAREAIAVLRTRCEQLSASLQRILERVATDERNARAVLDTEQGEGA
jgi:hypothetical protein